MNKEIIWHFSCKECKGWWSIANTDNWKPEKLFCTHCGKPYVSDTMDFKKEKVCLTVSEQMQEELEPLPE